MIRRVIRFALFLCFAQAVTLTVWTVGVALGSLSAQAEAPSPTTLGTLVVRDTFDDNTIGAMWQTVATDPNDCRMLEINRRLELRATGAATDASAGLVSTGWRLDSRYDFSMKVDWYFDVDDRAGSSISLGVVADAKSPWEKNAVLGVGYKSMFPHYWYRRQVGLSVESSMSQRALTSGQLCVSYNAADDELYLGFGGYGPENAWATFPGLLGDEWGSRPIFMWLGGDSTGSPVTAGRAYLDNFMVETGIVIEASLRDVHHFQSPVLNKHFYTVSEYERDFVLTWYKDIWLYEGVVYRAFANDCDPDSRPVHRFWSDRIGGHSYTLSAAEKDWLISEYSHVWTYEGVAFYVYPEGKQPAWARPVYRLWSPSMNCHFYTISDTERARMGTQPPQDWVDEGIAWYSLP